MIFQKYNFPLFLQKKLMLIKIESHCSDFFLIFAIEMNIDKNTEQQKQNYYGRFKD